MALNNALPPSTDWSLYWFAKLEKAVEEGDHQAAAEAERELARLGVRGNYGRSLPGREVSHRELTPSPCTPRRPIPQPISSRSRPRPSAPPRC